MPTLFLVEDNAADVELFRMALQSAALGCELVIFDDGREIIDYIREHNSTPPQAIPDLILLDLNLPKIDGVEVLQAIRNTPGFAHVPFVVLSSSSSFRERDKLAAFQILEYIVKPADLDEYLNIGETVRRLLHQAKYQQGQSA